MIRVLIVDDQAIVRNGLRLALGAVDDVIVVGDATDGSQAIRAVADLAPDVVLMDLRMPVLDGIAATTAITSATGTTRVLVLTTFADDELVFGALRAGASGYVLKDADPDDIIGAIRSVAAGDAVVSPAITQRVIDAALRIEPQRPASHQPDVPLTGREQEVLDGIVLGLTNNQIAERLYIGEATVKTHLSSLLTKVGARSRVQAVIWAYETGAVQPGPKA